MSEPYYDDGQAQIWHGDALETLQRLPDQSAHCCVTSPPYFALRDYGVDGQIGLEATHGDFIGKLVAVFHELRRVLRDDGTLFLNVGDSYAGSGKAAGDTVTNNRGSLASRGLPMVIEDGFKPKDLMMIPARLALALQADGWWLRSDIIWAKTAPMPESVTDRPTSAHEHIFLLSKRERYYYDAEAVKEQSEANEASHKRATYGGYSSGSSKRSAPNDGLTKPDIISGRKDRYWPERRNQRNVWLLGPDPSPEAHFAAFPREIPRRAILAGTSEHGVCAACGAPWERLTERTPMEIRHSQRSDAMGEYGRTQTSGTMVKPASSQTLGWQPSCTCDAPVIPATVIDPFMGSGRTAEVAKRLGRRVIGVELNRDYIDALIIPKCQQQSLLMETIEVPA